MTPKGVSISQKLWPYTYDPLLSTYETLQILLVGTGATVPRPHRLAVISTAYVEGQALIGKDFVISLFVEEFCQTVIRSSSRPRVVRTAYGFLRPT